MVAAAQLGPQRSVLAAAAGTCAALMATLAASWQGWIAMQEAAQGHAGLVAAIMAAVEVSAVSPEQPLLWAVCLQACLLQQTMAAALGGSLRSMLPGGRGAALQQPGECLQGPHTYVYACHGCMRAALCANALIQTWQLPAPGTQRVFARRKHAAGPEDTDAYRRLAEHRKLHCLEGSACRSADQVQMTAF